MPSRSTLLLPAAIVVTLLSWASAFIVIRGVAPEISGGALALGRLIVGTAALGIATLAMRTWVRPNAREWLGILIYGVAWFGVYNVVLNLAEHSLDGATTSMIVNVGPILIAIGGGVFLREGFSRWLGIGAAIAFGGVVLIAVATALAGGSARAVDPVGVVLALAAAVTYALGVLFQKPVLRRLPGVQVTFLGCAIGMLACLPFSGALIGEAAAAAPASLLGVAYLGLVPTALGFVCWAYASARMPASRLAISTYVVPPIAILLGWAFLGEIPVPLAFVGGVICLAGVAVSRRRAGRRDPVPQAAESLPE